MQITEIFTSLQGEGRFTGYPTIMIRTAGCNANCAYCDEPHSKRRGKNMTIKEIMTEVFKLRHRYVCITGGEPLLQEETYSLAYDLLAFGYNVSIETNGLLPIYPYTSRRSFTYCMDLKCPCSGEAENNCFNNLKELHSTDDLKCVVRDMEDIDFIIKTLKKYPTKAQVILSPLNNNRKVCRMIYDILMQGKIKGRIGMQLHKILKIA